MIKPLNIDAVKAYRNFRMVIKKLNLTTCYEGLKQSVDMFERLDFCRFMGRENREPFVGYCKHFP
jgi:hypothetical protein